MEVMTRRIPALLNTTGENAADGIDEEMGIPYSCPAQHRYSHHNDDAG
jgi:hypothetical protein